MKFRTRGTHPPHPPGGDAHDANDIKLSYMIKAGEDEHMLQLQVDVS